MEIIFPPEYPNPPRNGEREFGKGSEIRSSAASRKPAGDFSPGSQADTMGRMRLDLVLARRFAEMRLIKVGAAVLNQTPLAWRQNASNIREAIARAKAESVGIFCLPELCIPGYGCEDEFHSPGVWETSWEILSELVEETQGLVVSFGLPVFHQDGVYDTACLACDGKIVGFTAKRFLCGDGIHYEPRWFRPWPAGVQSQLRMHGRTYPLGDVHFHCLDQSGHGVKIGFEICEDAWVANRPGSQLLALRDRRDSEPQRQPFRVRQDRHSPAVRSGRLAGVRGELHLCKPAGQRSGPGDLRRRGDDRFLRNAFQRQGRGFRFTTCT